MPKNKNKKRNLHYSPIDLIIRIKALSSLQVLMMRV